MTGPVTTEALVEKLAQTMWEQSYGTLANASWAEAHRVAEAIPDGQAAWNIETARRKAAEIVNLHFAPLLAAHQQVTAERDEEKARADRIDAKLGELNAAVRECLPPVDTLIAERQAAEAAYATATSELAQLRAEGEAKDRRIGVLEAALAPFAKAGGLFGPRESNGWDVLIYSPAAGDEYCITADHLRAARAATAREG